MMLACDGERRKKDKKKMYGEKKTNQNGRIPWPRAHIHMCMCGPRRDQRRTVYTPPQSESVSYRRNFVCPIWKTTTGRATVGALGTL